MACKACSKRRRARGRSINANKATPVQSVAVQQTTFNGGDFVRMYYIGETGEVDSVLPQLSYGNKQYNTLMYVHRSDLAANPALWSETPVSQQDDFTTLNGVGQVTAQKFYDDGVTTFQQLKTMTEEQIKQYTNADILNQL